MPSRTLEAAENIEPASKTDGRLYVSPLSCMPVVFNRIRPHRLVTIINEQMVPQTPDGLATAAHLKLVCSDICEPADGRVCPEPQHVEKLIAFVQDWNHEGPLLIHCLAGISRSTAAAYITLCTLNRSVSEREIAGLLRNASPSAAPNRLLVDLADRALGRGGRMLEAIGSIAPGQIDGDEGEPFWLPSRLS